MLWHSHFPDGANEFHPNHGQSRTDGRRAMHSRAVAGCVMKFPADKISSSSAADRLRHGANDAVYGREP